MAVTVELPDDIVEHLGETDKVPGQILEAFAAEAYRKAQALPPSIEPASRSRLLADRRFPHSA